MIILNTLEISTFTQMTHHILIVWMSKLFADGIAGAGMGRVRFIYFMPMTLNETFDLPVTMMAKESGQGRSLYCLHHLSTTRLT